MTGAAPPGLPEALRFQARAARASGSALCARLLAGAAADAEGGGACAAALRGFEHEDAVASALPLRFLAAVHRLVLAGRAPALAAFYPSAGGGGADAGGDPWPAFREAVAAHLDEVRAGVAEPCQTNDPGRSAALVGGFLLAAGRTGLPLRVLELGASAGLNLRWDAYRYEAPGGAAWGDPASPLRLAGFEGRPPPFGVAATVESRRGCDPRPLDPADPDARLRLRSFVWPDQVERLARLDAALAVAERVPAVVDRAAAGGWLPERLENPVPGVATVVVHSVVWQYLGEEERRRVRAAIGAAGARATAEAPLAWLSMEPPASWVRGDPGARPDRAEVRLRSWPGGGGGGAAEELVARPGYHGAPVEWLA